MPDITSDPAVVSDVRTFVSVRPARVYANDVGGVGLEFLDRYADAALEPAADHPDFGPQVERMAAVHLGHAPIHMALTDAVEDGRRAKVMLLWAGTENPFMAERLVVVQHVTERALDDAAARVGN